jgi:hypothetical protein
MTRFQHTPVRRAGLGPHVQTDMVYQEIGASDSAITSQATGGRRPGLRSPSDHARSGGDVHELFE